MNTQTTSYHIAPSNATIAIDPLSGTMQYTRPIPRHSPQHIHTHRDWVIEPRVANTTHSGKRFTSNTHI